MNSPQATAVTKKKEGLRFFGMYCEFDLVVLYLVYMLTKMFFEVNLRTFHDILHTLLFLLTFPFQFYQVKLQFSQKISF